MPGDIRKESGKFAPKCGFSSNSDDSELYLWWFRYLVALLSVIQFYGMIGNTLQCVYSNNDVSSFDLYC